MGETKRYRGPRLPRRRPVVEAAAGPGDDPLVPRGVEVAAAWSWRLLVIGAALLALLFLIHYFAVVTYPLIVSLLAAALLGPAVRRLDRLGVPHKLSALLVVVLGLGAIALLLVFVVSQILNGAEDLSTQVVDALDQVRTWLRDGPLGISDADLQSALSSLQESVSDTGGRFVGYATEFGTAVGHVVAGAFIVLFATYFFLADGRLIWAWLVRIFPRVSRDRIDSSGRVAWKSLTQFVRATVLVAAVDAIGIVVVALILKVPFVVAIGVLVFLGAFVPLVGATVSGSVAVLVALIAQGPFVALLMLAGVVVVQQIEAHVLQPFVMGRLVSVHPLGVIVAIGTGVLLAGVAGALVAVPFAAALNAVVQHLAAMTEPGEDPRAAAARDPGTPDQAQGTA
ncbi:AI-2E family transporter [Marmoricola endophyticus]|uniref:AI-2E family transporter n=1 Tax=Marmoricola endophyticus TaxID=2040280 RepID=UPI001E34FE02|nr:AI-2E family transporter [Marmoricola endophyticus]